MTQTASTSETTNPDTLAFLVPGEAATQGSKRHLGNGIMVESSKKLPGWRSDIRGNALSAMQTTGWTTVDKTVPVRVELRFYLARPKSHYRTGRNAHLLRDSAPALPIQRQDIDKLCRSCLDALTSAGVWADDDQVVELIATKHYATPPTIGPGMGVTVTPL